MGHAAMAATAVRCLKAPGAPGAPGTPLPPRPDRRPPVAPAEVRRVLGNFPSGVTVIAARDGEGPAGFACQSFSSLSLDPPLVLFLVGRASASWPRIARAGVFCATVLGEEQGGLCRAFAVSGADKFAGVAHTPAPVTGSPLLAGGTAWADCAIRAVHTGGDHLIVVGRIEALGTTGDGEPLVFHRGRFRGLRAPGGPGSAPAG
ncbi:hypothetical protein GCM10010232_03350 [Streptomyces amakusaensis]|uniref:Flavin reductase family protein n=2 Tax=Streptomyces amakusaensis TaxID=67271 RepID=A0ABW0AM97_9ACTN